MSVITSSIPSDKIQAELALQVLPKPVEALSAKLNDIQLQALRGVQDGNFESRHITSIVYLANNPGQLAFTSEDVVEITKLTAYGALAGSIAGGKGAAIGAGAAAGASIAICVTDKVFKALTSAEYRRFYRLRQLALRNELIQKFLIEDDELRHFVCPLSGQLPGIPVTVHGPINKKNMHFDFAAIVKWLKSNPGKEYPGFGGIFSQDDLEVDFPCISSIVRRLEQLIKSCLSQDEIAQIALLLPFDKKEVKQLILEFRGYDVNKINRILINTLNVSLYFQKTRDTHIRQFIKRLCEKREKGELSKEQIGWRLRDFKVWVCKSKIPLLTQPSFIGTFFGASPQLNGFATTEAEIEERCLGDDKAIITEILEKEKKALSSPKTARRTLAKFAEKATEVAPSIPPVS